MRPLLHAHLVNGRFGDPALYVATVFEKGALLFDLGDITALPTRNIHRLERIFVSHAHIDHFIGFDHLLRLLVGREKRIHLYGPEGFIDQVRHKIHAYRWNLIERFVCDLAVVVTEIGTSLGTRSIQFRLKGGFADEMLDDGSIVGGVLHSEATFRVFTTILEHRTPCLAFAVEEAAHVNIWKNRLAELRLPVGPWLRGLKRAVIENRPDDYPIPIYSPLPAATTQALPLGVLRGALTLTAGQKIAYVTDVADTTANREAIVHLAHGADLLFIEAAFAKADAALAAERAHLTTEAAGRIARAASARRIEPFHFSPRYAGQEKRMLSEVITAFEGQACAGKDS